MSTKKILLPESTIKDRSRDRERERKPRSDAPTRQRKAPTRSNSRTVPLVTDARQRNEAVGLVLVGVSAFSLSLIHYISSSQIPGLINAVMVQLGMGVYILPMLVGFMGIQRFLERPFQNLGWRIAGCFGVMAFGLGLLGMEGGKLGLRTFQLFSGIFGVVPSQILFTFLLLSSMIFALDILYKDLLAASLVIASLTTRLIIFTWEVTLALLAMLIGAVKTTADLCVAIVSRIKQTVSEQNIDPAQQLGKLLSFKPRTDPELDEELDEELIDDETIIADTTKPATATALKAAQKDIIVEEATVIPVPQSWQDQISGTQETSATIPPSQEAGYTVQVTQLVTECIMPDAAISTTTATTPLPHRQTNTNDDEVCDENDEELSVVVELDEDEDEDDDSDENSNITNVVSHETMHGEEPVFLEDNTIDREIKTGEFVSQKLREHRNVEVLLPPLEILKVPEPRNNHESQSDLSQRSAFLLKTLEEFGIKATVTAIVEGPSVSRFELKPAPGVKVSRITALVDDIALALSAPSIRIEAPIPGKPALGIEIPNSNPTPVYFYDLLKNDSFKKNQFPLNLALGVTINGKPVFADLAEMPHLLIAGSTGSGKSVCVNTIIASILFQARADQVKFVMIDPKMVELSSYNGIPHLIAPVVTDPAKAAGALLWAVEEMTRRYEILAGCGCKKIATYNEEIERLQREVDPDLEPMPFIVIIIDELADLMMTASAEVEGSICRLAQMARAVGMHLIIATQRPSVNVLTGLIKANLPTRIAFSVTSAIDSRTILDAKGAERLLGKGDMLFIPKGRNKPLRLQGAYVSDRELMDLVEFVKTQGRPEYMDIAPTISDEDDDGDDDDSAESGDADSPLIAQIISYLETQEKTSTSMLQRKFRIGYNRAARIMDQLEEKGLVSPMDGSNKRRVLIGRSSTQV